MTTDTASSRIRASIAAVVERTNDPGGWYARPGEVRTIAEDTQGSGGSRGWLVIKTYDSGADQALAEHIALLASPNVAAALADLLDAIHPRGHGAGYDCDAACLDDINTARDALEAAILREHP